MNTIDIEVVEDQQQDTQTDTLVELTSLELCLVGGGTVSVTYL